MRVRFGMHRDGLEAAAARTAVGEITVGPREFLRQMESDLGIASVTAHPAEALAAYRDCLAECDGSVRFYHRSFAVDPVGVARTLLDWREAWYLHGWDGTFPASASRRLADMAAVERVAAERVPPCAGQRLRRILKLLDTHRTQIRELELLDSPDDLPAMWWRLAERFDGKVLPEPAGCAARDSDLGKVQALLENGSARPLTGDGSLVVLRAVSRDVTAQAVAEMLCPVADLSRTVVIAARDDIILDNALQRVGLHRAGFQHYSPFRAASQVLKLVLALVWKPLDPHRLLQFLIHPVSPLPWKVRAKLADAVAAQPGIGGPAWREAVADMDDTAEDIAFWTAPERHDAADGAPVAALLGRIRRCGAWLGQQIAIRQEDEEKAVFGAAEVQAKALAVMLEHRSEPIPKLEVDRLVDEIARPQRDASTFPEAGCVPATDRPGNVAEPVDEVFWWDLAPANLDLAPVWSKAEGRELAAAGVHLPTPEERLAADIRAWQRPVLNCRRRLVLVVHDEHEGRHPLWGRIEQQLPGFVDVDLDEGLLCGARTSWPS